MTPNVEGNRRAALPPAEDQGVYRRVRLTVGLGRTAKCHLNDVLGVRRIETDRLKVVSYLCPIKP